MSSLLDKLEQVSQPALRRLGFAISEAIIPPPPMVIVSRYLDNGIQLLQDSASTTDAGIIGMTETSSIKEIIKIGTHFGDTIPWGIQLDTVPQLSVDELHKAGCDYVVFGVEDTMASVLNHEVMGKVLSVAVDLEDKFVRVLEDIPAEALILENENKGHVTLKQLMEYRIILSAVSKPVLISASASIFEEDVTSLYNLGMVGIVIDIKTKDDVNHIARLRQVIESLPPREVDDKGSIGPITQLSAHSTSMPTLNPDEDEE